MSLIAPPLPSNAPTLQAPAFHVKTEEEKRHEQLVVGSLLGVGSGCVAYGSARYFENYRLLQNGKFKPAYWGALGMEIAVAELSTVAWVGSLRAAEARSRAEAKSAVK